MTHDLPIPCARTPACLAARFVRLPEATVEALRTAKVDAIAIREPCAWGASRAPGPHCRVRPGDAGWIETFDLAASRRPIPSRHADLTRLLGAVAVGLVP